ncbi:MAG: DNA-formamidopyrimidine glycosylase [Patescibacteria group bacterium]
MVIVGVNNMPELPEVETVVRGLTKHIVGQKIKSVKILHPRSFVWDHSMGPIQPSITDLTINKIYRRGKGIIINLSKDLSILIHLKMTGQLIYVEGKSRLNFGHPDPNFTLQMPSKHTRVILSLSKGTLYFNDQRLFGWVKIIPTNEIPNDKFIRNLGPEPFDLKFNLDYLWPILKRRAKSNIKSIIMDQSVVTGVGNIYADESLFLSGLKPTRLGIKLTQKQAAELIKNIQGVLKKGIKYMGTSISHYKTDEGASGKMQNHLNVYGRKGLPCKNCGQPISKTRLNGRGTHYCHTCQL